MCVMSHATIRRPPAPVGPSHHVRTHSGADLRAYIVICAIIIIQSNRIKQNVEINFALKYCMEMDSSVFGVHIKRMWLYV